MFLVSEHTWLSDEEVLYVQKEYEPNGLNKKLPISAVYLSSPGASGDYDDFKKRESCVVQNLDDIAGFSEAIHEIESAIMMTDTDPLIEIRASRKDLRYIAWEYKDSAALYRYGTLYKDEKGDYYLSPSQIESLFYESEDDIFNFVKVPERYKALFSKYIIDSV